MGRRQDDGLRYFPKDVDFYSDDKVKILKARYGSDGVVLYDYLLCLIYHDGYCKRVQNEEDFIYLLGAEWNMTAEKIGQILNFLFERSLLDGTLFKSDKVLTSRGIQKQYQSSKKGAKRDIAVDGKLWLLPPDETLGFIKVKGLADKSGNKANTSEKKEDSPEKNDTKESKVKESKKRKVLTPPTLEQVKEYCQGRGNKINAQKFYDYYEASGWKDGSGKAVLNWEQKAISWEDRENKTDGLVGYGRNVHRETKPIRSDAMLGPGESMPLPKKVKP